MVKEVQSHTKNEVWELVLRSSVPLGTKMNPPAVWAIKRKQRIATREVYKWKQGSTLMDPSKRKVSILGNILTSGIMGTVRMVLITTLIHAWYTKEIDFVLAYTQGDVECQLYMSIPKGSGVQDHDQDYVLKLKKNVLGKKQAGRVWNQHLVNKLKEVGFI